MHVQHVAQSFGVFRWSLMWCSLPIRSCCNSWLVGQNCKQKTLGSCAIFLPTYLGPLSCWWPAWRISFAFHSLWVLTGSLSGFWFLKHWHVFPLPLTACIVLLSLVFALAIHLPKACTNLPVLYTYSNFPSNLHLTKNHYHSSQILTVHMN